MQLFSLYFSHLSPIKRIRMALTRYNPAKVQAIPPYPTGFSSSRTRSGPTNAAAPAPRLSTDTAAPLSDCTREGTRADSGTNPARQIHHSEPQRRMNQYWLIICGE